jgi:hypothetical protein
MKRKEANWENNFFKVRDCVMAEKMILPGWVQEVGEPIEFPDIAELLMYPMYNKVSPEDLRKTGTEFQKMLLDKVPIRGVAKYITIYSWVQFLHPKIRSNMLKLKGVYENEWHVDREPSFAGNSSWHIIMNDCTARTEFCIHDLEIDKEDYYNPNYLECVKAFNNGKYSITGRKCDPFRFHSFGSFNLHRSTTAEKPEFRFFFRVMENDSLAPNSLDIAYNYSSPIWMPDGKTFESIIPKKNEITIKFNMD